MMVEVSLAWRLKVTLRARLTSTGCIINISSLLGLKGGRGSVGYAASKAGVIGRPPSIRYHFTFSCL
jgi:NAD(P)-dependent dehydrogenase (short-subunit alcohol dehydrogenase family)